MTVIAWDGKTFAVDRRVTWGEVVGTRTKLFHVRPGCALATFGDTDKGIILREWFKDGADPKAWPSFQSTDNWVGMVVVDHGVVYEYNQECSKIVLEDPFMAWGSGSRFALGAMAHGATAIEAVEIAGRLCSSCGNGHDSYIWSDDAEAQ